ncbi:MAG: ribonuclease HI family protein [bacterium]|nr:ribonuclease HI family protein [bacterium]
MDIFAFIDGGARGNPGPAAIGVVVRDADGNVLFEEGKTIGHATNNEAEYQALIHLLEKCASDPVLRASGAKTLHVRSDSTLLVMQITGKWKIKEPRLRALYDDVQKVKDELPFALRIRHVPREKNKEADKLVNQAMDAQKN